MDPASNMSKLGEGSFTGHGTHSTASNAIPDSLPSCRSHSWTLAGLDT